jgi:hypothetical protein
MIKLWTLTAALALHVISAQAEITTWPTAEAANKGSDSGASWAGVLDKTAAPTDAQTAAKEPAEARLLKEHLAEEERAIRLANVKAATRLKADAVKATAAKTGDLKNDDDNLFRDLANTVKEVVRPLKETADELRKTQEDAAAIPVPVIEAPKQPQAMAPATIDGQRQLIVSGMLWEEFVAEMKPWAIGLGIALVLGLGVMRLLAAAPSKRLRSRSRKPLKKSRRRTA